MDLRIFQLQLIQIQPIHVNTSIFLRIERLRKPLKPGVRSGFKVSFPPHMGVIDFLACNIWEVPNSKNREPQKVPLPPISLGFFSSLCNNGIWRYRNETNFLLGITLISTKKIQFFYNTVLCFNPPKGIILIPTVTKAIWEIRLKSFNPPKGIILIPTKANLSRIIVLIVIMFQSPEGDYFNSYSKVRRCIIKHTNVSIPRRGLF